MNILKSSVASLLGLGSLLGATTQDYSLALFQECLKQEEGNVVLSPYSAAACLDLLRPGAAGETREEFDKLLGNLTQAQLKSQRESASIELLSADRVYLEQQMKLQQAYQDSLPAGSVQAVDFSGAPDLVRGEINTWIAKVTNDCIKDMLPQGSISAMTRLVAVNAIYMKAEWQRPFQAHLTADDEFTTASGAIQMVPFMSNETSYRVYEADGAKLVALEYRPQQVGAKETCMSIILPPAGQDARKWVAELNAQKLSALQAGLAAAAPQRIKLFLPKFKIETGTVSLQKPLEAMGLRLAFTDMANFSKMAEGNESLYLSAILQKCFVAVDEKGTEAAAATAGVMNTMALVEPAPQVRVDRPFIWVIGELDAGSTPYFMGIVETLAP